MNLDNVTVEMRPRSEWEATDFGARMIRRDAAAIYKVWFAVTLPLLAIAMLVVFFTPYWSFALLLYWWFEPVADGAILRVISRRLFGEDANVRETLRAVPILAWKNRLFLLTPYRLHFARSVAMPVTQLEGLGGSARRARSKVLNLKIFNYGVGISAAYEHLVLALYIGIILIGTTFIPAAYLDTLGDSWTDLFWLDSSPTATAARLLVFYAAQTALQPWFVGAGFGLYINCRTQLEAWDIEVAFRRMVQRRAGTVAAAALLAMLIIPPLVSPTPAYAQEPEAAETEQPTEDDPGFVGFWTDDEVSVAMEAILASDALNTTEETEEWQRRRDVEPEPDTEEKDMSALDAALERLFNVISMTIEFGLWITVAVVILIIFLMRNRWLPYVGFETSSRPAARKIYLAGGELTADQLPDDIVAEVQKAWRAGRKREALSLLYRGSVFAAVTEHGVRLPRSATEGACIRAVAAQTDNACSGFFRRVVHVWVRCAYGNQDPSDDAVLPLCSEWPQHFGPAR